MVISTNYTSVNLFIYGKGVYFALIINIINMAIAIKSIPVLTGKAAERFVSMADANKGNATTVVPKDMRAAIKRMKERSNNFIIKYPH